MYYLSMKQGLDFNWLFAKGHQEEALKGGLLDAEVVDLPHNVTSSPYHYFTQGEFLGEYTYECLFDDGYPALKSKTLVFEGAMLKIHVYLNEEDLGNYVSGYFPVSINISGKLLPKGNKLAVFLTMDEDPNIPPFGYRVDYLSYAGLYRRVYIDHRREAHIEDVFPIADEDGNLTIKTTLNKKIEDLVVVHHLYQGEVEITSFQGNSFHLNGARLYSIEDPYLYSLKTTYGDDEVITRIGFRTASWQEDGFYLNSKKVKLIGLNRHQTYPYFGGAAPAGLQRIDARILKQTGINIVRSSHYADDESFLDECDKLGLLVIDEIPGWQHIGLEAAWRKQCVDFARRLILKERKHPCLIAYGLRIDESVDDEELYSAIQQVHKELDPYRPSLGVRNIKHSQLLEDIYAYNDFKGGSIHKGIEDPKKLTNKPCPKIITENNGHMFPCKSFDTPNRVEEHALRHARMIDDAYKYKDLCGMLSWCAFDYATHEDFGNGDGICYHGVFDIFRNPKLASYVYASQSEKEVFEVGSLMKIGDYDRCAMNAFYAFTNADYVELYRNEDYIGRFFPDRKLFPYMPHPPIKIDDFVGNRLNEKRLTKGLNKRLRKALNYLGSVGFVNIPKWVKATISFCAFLCGYDEKSYKGRWFNLINHGEKGTYWRIEAYKDGRKMGEKKFSPSTSYHYESKQYNSSLSNEGGADATMVSIEKLDQNNNHCPYADDELNLSVTGPISIMGPSQVNLVGGKISIFIRSLKVNKKEKATLEVVNAFNERLTFEFEINP